MGRTPARVLWAVGTVVQKQALHMQEAHVWLLVTKCSPQASCGPHPQLGRGATKVDEACPDSLGAGNLAGGAAK